MENGFGFIIKTLDFANEGSLGDRSWSDLCDLLLFRDFGLFVGMVEFWGWGTAIRVLGAGRGEFEKEV